MLSGNAFRHQIILPEQQAFYDYWRAQCKGNKLPSRHDIDPSDISAQLHMTTLTERRPSATGHRYRIRLAGTGFWKFYGSEIQGKHIDDLPIGCRVDYWHRVLDQVIETKKPYVGVTKPNTPTGGHMAQFWVRLPLSENGKDIDMILGYDHLVKLSDVTEVAGSDQKIYA